jgi:hypothetical protein
MIRKMLGNKPTPDGRQGYTIEINENVHEACRDPQLWEKMATMSRNKDITSMRVSNMHSTVPLNVVSHNVGMTLTVLDLNACKLNIIPYDFLTGFVVLRYLSMMGNDITSMNETLSLPKLIGLNLANNRLKSFPSAAALLGLCALQSINLTNNDIVTINKNDVCLPGTLLAIYANQNPFWHDERQAQNAFELAVSSRHLRVFTNGVHNPNDRLVSLMNERQRLVSKRFFI